MNGKHVNPNSFYNFEKDKFISDSILIAQRSAGSYLIKPVSFDLYGSLSPDVKKQEKSGTSRLKATRQKRASGNQRKFTYVIKKVDTLEVIALKNNTTIEKLCNANQLNPSILLQIGHKIILP